MSRAGSVADLRSHFENPPDTRTPEQLSSVITDNDRHQRRALRFSDGQPSYSKTSLSPDPPTIPPKPVDKDKHMNGVKRTSLVSISVTSDIENELRETVASQTQKIESILAEKEELEKKLEEVRKKLEVVKKESKKKMTGYQNKLDKHDRTVKARRSQSPLAKWSFMLPSISDLHKPIIHDDLGDPHELIQQFVESERLYLNSLEALYHHFYQPIQMLAIFKQEIVSSQQLFGLFLNIPQLMVVHRLFYEQLAHLRYFPYDTRMEEFLVILERTVPSFAIYNCFQSENFMQNLQRELCQCQSKQQFSMLLEHLEEKCNGKTLIDLLRIPASRLSEYHVLLSLFTEDRVKASRGMTDGVIKRLDDIKQYFQSLQLDLLERSAWELMMDKLKLLQRISPDGPIPYEIFYSETKLVKQGPIIAIVKGKEKQKHCFLTSGYIALADRAPDHRYVFPESAMIPLSGASLFKVIDTEGQIIQPDLLSGLQQDMLGFRINLTNGHEPLVFRVGRPNEYKAWVESIEKTLESLEDSNTDSEALIPDSAPKIAAASLEKLFQHLTNPQIAYREDFIEVFLNTYPCFTTSMDVLTALVNCIKSPKEKTPEPTASSAQATSDHVFTFNMEDNDIDSTCSTSLTSMSASNSMQNLTSGSESDSPSSSPAISKRKRHSSSVSIGENESTQLPKHITSSDKFRNSLSTTDSDSSPYTSGVPIAHDDPKVALDGWQESDTPGSDGIKGLMSEVGVSRYGYRGTSPFHQPSASIDESDEEMEDVDFPNGPRPSMGFEVHQTLVPSENHLSISTSDLPHDTDAMFDNVTSSLRAMCDTLDPAEFEVPRSGTSLSNYSFSEYQTRHNEELDDAQRMLTESVSVLDTSSQPSRFDEEDSLDTTADLNSYRKYTATRRGPRQRRNTETPLSPSLQEHRLSISSTLSLSEPDLVLAAITKPSSPLTLPSTTSRTAATEREDDLQQSLPPTILRKFCDPNSHELSASLNIPSSKRATGRFSLGILGKKDKSARERETRRSTPNTSLSGRLSVASSNNSALYFGSPEPPKKPQGSPSRFGFFKKKGKMTRSASAASDFTDGGDVTPGVKVNRAPSFNAKMGSVYVNIDEFGSPKRSVRERMENGSPKIKRKLTKGFKNFSLAEKIFTVLNKWIDARFEDFEENEKLMTLLEEFLDDTINSYASESKLAEQTLSVMKQSRTKVICPNPNFGVLLSRITKDPAVLTQYDWEKPSKLMGGLEIDLSKASTAKDQAFLQSIAEQITLMEYACYSAIQRRELLNCNWKKKDKEDLAPNVCRMIKRTNELTSWVCSEILSRDTPTQRATVIENFIKIAMYCYRHNDMHCALTIAVALRSTCIKRLAKSWDTLDKKYRQKYEKLKSITDPQDRCKKLRDRLDAVTAEAKEKNGCISPCLPYMGAYLEMIYTLDIGLKTYNSDGLVNFAKMTKLSSLIHMVLQYQSAQYSFKAHLDIIAYITAAKRHSENDLYDISIEKEPNKR